MRPRSLLVLTVLVLGLGAFVWFYERKLPSTEEAKAQEKKVLAGIESDQVREVTIARDGSTVRLLREGVAGAGEETKADEAPPALAGSVAEWRLESSGAGARLAARADRSAVEGLLSSLLALEKERTFAKADRTQYGLAPPAAQVTLTTAKGKSVLEVGRELPGTEQRAVSLAGSPAVQVVANSFWSDLVRPAGEWRSKELFPGTREDVERVSLQHDGTKVLLARRGDEPWLEAPLVDRADQERFDQLVDALTGLQAVEFLDQPPAPPAGLGLEPPQEVVEVVRKGQSRPFRLELGNGTPQTATTPAAGSGPGEAEQTPRYARADGQLVTIKAPPLDEAATRPPQEWRARGWTSFAVWEVDKVEVKDAQGALTLTRADSDWKRGNVKIFYGAVSDFLSALSDAKASRVLDAADAKGMTGGAPMLTVTLTGSGGKGQTLTLWPSQPAGAGAPARTSGRDAVLLLPAAVPGDLAQKLSAIRKAEPLKEAPTPTPAP